jgi:hypothetical protein
VRPQPRHRPDSWEYRTYPHPSGCELQLCPRLPCAPRRKVCRQPNKDLAERGASTGAFVDGRAAEMAHHGSIAAWLAHHGLSKHLKLFQEAEVDLEVRVKSLPPSSDPSALSLMRSALSLMRSVGAMDAGAGPASARGGRPEGDWAGEGPTRQDPCVPARGARPLLHVRLAPLCRPRRGIRVRAELCFHVFRYVQCTTSTRTSNRTHGLCSARSRRQSHPK